MYIVQSLTLIFIKDILNKIFFSSVIMTTIIKSHFQSVKLNCFREKSKRKGRHLVMGYHVSDVREERRDNYCYIKGTVLRETPGSHSTRKHENLYYPVAEVPKYRLFPFTFHSLLISLSFE